MNWFVILSSLAFLGSCQSAPKVDTGRKTQSMPINLPVYTEPTVRTNTEITLAFVGDVIIHERIRVREEKTNEGFQTIWSNIQNFLEKADFTYANLEGPVAPEYGGVTGFPMFNFPESIIPALKNSGFDIVSTANNHSLDRQAKGIRKTIENLNKNQLSYTGTIDQEIRVEQGLESWWALTPIENSQKIIAWIACTEMTNGNPDKEDQVLYCFKHEEKMKALVRTLKTRKDIAAIIVTPHWGEEAEFVPEPHLKRWAYRMLEEGVTAIVGSHPHVLRRIETHTTKDNRKTIVAYSLGNFVSNQPWTPNKTSMILYLKFNENPKENLLELKDIKYIPLWTIRTIEKDHTSKFRVQPIWDLKKVPAESRAIWEAELGHEKRIKSEIEVSNFLKK